MGVPCGVLAGFLGGATETTIMRLTDMLMAFPILLLALLMVTALGGSLVNEILAIGVALTPNFVRLAYSLALTTKANDYIMAARAQGGRSLRIMLRHIFPNIMSTLAPASRDRPRRLHKAKLGSTVLRLGYLKSRLARRPSPHVLYEDNV
jgi:ABC-type dipeptide/oligopeptide/nickel transport system permease subunit